MYIHPRIKVALFLLLAGNVGGFALATKLTQYFFEKSQAGKGGGNDQTVMESDEGGDGKKKGKVNEDDGGDGEGDSKQRDNDDLANEGEDKIKVGEVIDGGTAVRYLIGKSIRLNPGEQPARYSYHVARSLMGEGLPGQFSVRSWVRRQNMLCEATKQGLLDCNKITIVVGVPKGHEYGDEKLTAKEAKAVAAKAKVIAKGTKAIQAKADEELIQKIDAAKAALDDAKDGSNSVIGRLASAKEAAGKVKTISQAAVKSVAAHQLSLEEKKAAQEALAARIAESIPLDENGNVKRKPAFGEQIATLVIGDEAFPILKGNLIGFPSFVPSVDKVRPRAEASDDDDGSSKPKTDAKDAPTKDAGGKDSAAKPAAPQPAPAPQPVPSAPSQIQPAVASAPPPPAPAPPSTPKGSRNGFEQPKGQNTFQDPQSKIAGFAPPKAIDKKFKSVNDVEPGVTGQSALDRLFGKALVPPNFKPNKLPPYLGFFEKDGNFLQITRDWTAPFEALVTITKWAMRDGRLCLTGAPTGIPVAPPGETPAPASASFPPPAAKPAPKKAGKPGATPKPPLARGTGCIVPQVMGNDETNIVSIKGEKLTIASTIELPNLDSLKVESYGPFRPNGFRSGPAPTVGVNAKADEKPSGAFGFKI